MQLEAVLQSLFLLVLANGAPLVAKRVFGSRFAAPLDGGLLLPDFYPVFGASKTVRGIACSVLVTALAGWGLGIGWQTGALFGGLAMAGDLLASFTKRRLKLPASSRATGIDQIPEALLPLFGCRAALDLTLEQIALCVLVFMLGEIFGSRLLYRLRFRDRPY
jgi:CDP-diglyceride synthetase